MRAPATAWAKAGWESREATAASAAGLANLGIVGLLAASHAAHAAPHRRCGPGLRPGREDRAAARRARPRRAARWRAAANRGGGTRPPEASADRAPYRAGRC